MVWIMEKHLDNTKLFKSLFMRLSLFTFCVAFASAQLIYGANNDTIYSKYNSKFLVEPNKQEGFHFFLGGHLYGDAGHQTSIYPSPSLIANIDTINSSGASFFISLGDNVRESNKVQWSNFKNSFTNKLEMPFFSVMGNHDTLANAELAVKLYGPTFYTFRHQKHE